MSKFAVMYFKVLLPLKLDWTPTYSSDIPLNVGERVHVLFAHKPYVGVCLGEDQSPSVETGRIQGILGIVDNIPAVSSEELEFWQFISAYYMCTLGEVYKSAVLKDSKLKDILGQKRCQNSIPGPAEVIISHDRNRIYASLCQQTVRDGNDVLVLVPEMRLTAGLQKALKAAVGDNVHTFNSSMTPAQKRKVVQDIQSSDEPLVVIGTRSSVFLPFRSLGLVIVEEEQDGSHKQENPSPRYNGRDAAIVLAGIHGARAVLGTSCPSFETLLNLRTGKYVPFGSCSIDSKLLADGVAADNAEKISIIDLSAEIRKNGVRDGISFKMADIISGTTGKIAVIRGWESPDDLSDLLASRFPDKKISVITANAAVTSSSRYQLIAIMQADSLFEKADFRSDEHVLQTLSRLAGKADRMAVQTGRAGNPLFSILCGKSDPMSMLEERRAFNLPPFTRIVDTVLVDRNPSRKKKFEFILGRALPESVIIQDDGKTVFRTMLPRNPSTATLKEAMVISIRNIEKEYKYYGHIHFDVDPL